jgi:hypothetical protein
MIRVLAENKVMRAALDSVLDPFGTLHITGEEYDAALWDIRLLLASALSYARRASNLLPLDPCNPLRSKRKAQIAFDGMGWTKGKGCVRLIIRPTNLIDSFNNPMFCRDILFYIGHDKADDLASNFRFGGAASVHAVLFDAMRIERKEQVPFGLTCTSRMALGECAECDEDREVNLTAGGDMAAAHSGWGLDSPIARYGCCFYCTLPKRDWFDAGKCKLSTRRNLVHETCAAHLNPFTMYPALRPFAPAEPLHCSHCNF